jgi:uncharacterized repeat protein (TIGR03803 family)
MYNNLVRHTGRAVVLYLAAANGSEPMPRYLFSTYAFVAVCMTTGLPGQTFTKLLDFGEQIGFGTQDALIQGFDGALYGTTPYGGAYNYGTIFRLSGNSLTTLHSFDGTDGQQVYAPLVRSLNGKFYGTTSYGGVYNRGTVYEITPDGTFATIYSFCADWNGQACLDGEYPSAGLVVANSGDLFGPTQYGGSGNIQNGGGTIFRITPSGTLTTLYNFCTLGLPCTNGLRPGVPLVQAADGQFYGSAVLLFAMGPAGRFHSLGDLPSGIGAGPSALVQAPDGNLYGTTAALDNSYGSVFRLTPGGEVTPIYNFSTQSGYNKSGLVVGSDGNLYGTTSTGGSNDGGTIFKVTLSGELTTLYNFCSAAKCLDGGDPEATLVQATNGVFYGTTLVGGTHNEGTLFSLSVGLGPFVEIQPSAAETGAAVAILGPDLSGTTSVWFNGSPASFKVISKSLIAATVPNGAEAGTVRVQIPGGTLSSNVPFWVRP